MHELGEITRLITKIRKKQQRREQEMGKNENVQVTALVPSCKTTLRRGGTFHTLDRLDRLGQGWPISCAAARGLHPSSSLNILLLLFSSSPPLDELVSTQMQATQMLNRGRRKATAAALF